MSRMLALTFPSALTLTGDSHAVPSALLPGCHAPSSNGRSALAFCQASFVNNR